MYLERLKKIRERKGVTQSELAALLKVQRPAYTQFENESVTIPLIHLNTLCNYFDVSLDYIFSLTDELNYSYINKEIRREIFAKRLKEFRKDNKITQVVLSDYLNTPHSTISGYENGITFITTSFLYAICKKYGMSADYLLGRTEGPVYLDKEKESERLENMDSKEKKTDKYI